METQYDNQCSAEVTGSRRISPPEMDEVRAIDLRIDEPAFRFHEGQTVGVLVQGANPFGSKPHHRYYSIASARPQAHGDEVELQLIVRRCFYIDEFSGERYPGIASNYLCDARPGDHITLTGPYRSVFRMPQNRDANLLMIGTGTGIAPFRAFIQRIYAQHGGWEGKVRLFFGDRSGLDLAYLNQVDKDFANYYTRETFEAYQAITKRYVMSEAEALEETLDAHGREAWDMLQDPATHTYVAGTRKNSGQLDKVFSEYAGSEEAWLESKEKLREAGRWSELLYS
ncbi:MAG: oxidoreductase [Gammaproteobacteria bacterium]|nr:MAG: oxidoreductase [Gammaproteobacteria bacterium]RTZ73957.1 MAG: oxidoreductase [Gammaproteobacteria bacterium]RTZ80321.1 MAG: oxidoreductase [Gammaproteobacteria bacterium]